jgi:hypothetical protein
MSDQKQINFTIVPDEDVAQQGAEPRTVVVNVPQAQAPGRIYANFCAIAHTPFDFTLTFCEVTPLSPRDVQQAEAEGVVRAPIKAKIVAPVQFIPQLIAALQDHMRVYSESYGTNPPQGPVH